MVEFYKSYQEQRRTLESDPEWQRDNLEYDLRTSEYMLEKVRKDEYYAQNLYAALCQNEYIKNQPWNILAEKSWGCSWRYAGGIIADMREEGDYIDWYCSGIRGEWSKEQFDNSTKEEQERYTLILEKYVGEGVLTNEVKEDLFKLGWLPVDDNAK